MSYTMAAVVQFDLKPGSVELREMRSRDRRRRGLAASRLGERLRQRCASIPRNAELARGHARRARP